jgi:nitrate reductase delta subunit
VRNACRYDCLATLLEYPRCNYHDAVEQCRVACAAESPQAARCLERFARRIADLDVERLQELYTQTFDFSSDRSLDIGWQLFGENYERGEFLVWMRQQLRRLGVPESTELPDHLSHALKVLGRMAPADAERFAGRLLPAVQRVHVALANTDLPFADLLAAVVDELRRPQLAACENSHG